MLKLSLRSAFRLSVVSFVSVKSLSTTSTRVVWFRDFALRIHDNAALASAILSNDAGIKTRIQPISLFTFPNLRTGGTARDVFTVNALSSLNQSLSGTLKLGMITSDCPRDTAKELIHACRSLNSREIYYLKSQDNIFESELEKILIEHGLCPKTYNGSNTLLDYSTQKIPWKEIIFNDPWRSPLIPFVEFLVERLEKNPATPISSPKGLEMSLNKIDLTNKLFTNPVDVMSIRELVGTSSGGTRWGDGICKKWPASEEKALENLHHFLNTLEANQGEKKVTHLASHLSPYLARGLLSPKLVYEHIQRMKNQVNVSSFLRRICWRDYSMGVCALFPELTNGIPIRSGYEALQNGLENVPVEEKARRLHAWKTGVTGFPLIDAGMRQLDAEGWMPQKVRLACATLLVEGLGLSWRDGMQHFADFLIDFDPAINSNMWQNAGLVGFDPYYVGMNFKRRNYWDEDGCYIRKWVAELQNLPDFVDVPCKTGHKRVDCLYEPWNAPESVLLENNIYLGITYPKRICDERETRSLFFAAARSVRKSWPDEKIDSRKRDLVSLVKGNEPVGMFTPRAIQLHHY